MGLLDGLKKTVDTAVGQLTNSAGVKPLGTVDARELRFTANFVKVAKANGLSEKDAKDVYYHGSLVKQHMMCRTYNGYQLCIYYFVSPSTGQTFISSIWKQERR